MALPLASESNSLSNVGPWVNISEPARLDHTEQSGIGVTALGGPGAEADTPRYDRVPQYSLGIVIGRRQVRIFDKRHHRIPVVEYLPRKGP